jgi:hypothetical protein
MNENLKVGDKGILIQSNSGIDEYNGCYFKVVYTYRDSNIYNVVFLKSRWEEHNWNIYKNRDVYKKIVKVRQLK